MAEAVFRHYVNEEGLADRIQIDSAGTYRGHVGQAPHHGTQKKLTENQISYQGIVARHVKVEDLERFTYVIGMDDQNVHDLFQLANQKTDHIYRFVDFIPNTSYTEVPDPYYTGDFEETFQLVSAGCRQLLKTIKQRLNSP